ncbi:GntR family transcriptional regulator [Effusibacillus pohliae]|uniref:GntR family transcriptional regulator n=1 Tax=Effusibacillus pohliae TaxID=232270 RepID=UPI000368302C|nr:GntR family transcriptional regulator [Effusibacillus pohliae]
MDAVEVGGLRFRLDLTKPLYEQVLQQIRYAVARGEITLGTKIPSVRELAQQLRINPNTVMRAYQELERDGLVETRRGQGTFITSSAETVEQVKKVLAAEAVQSFVDSLKALGIDRKTAQMLVEEAEWE